MAEGELLGPDGNPVGGIDYTSYLRAAGHEQSRVLEELAAAALERDPLTQSAVGRSVIQDIAGGLKPRVARKSDDYVDEILKRRGGAITAKRPITTVRKIFDLGDCIQIGDRVFQNVDQASIEVFEQVGWSEAELIRVLTRAGMKRIAGPKLDDEYEYLEPSDQAIRARKRGKIDFNAKPVCLVGAINSSQPFEAESEYRCAAWDRIYPRPHRTIEEFVACTCGFHALAEDARLSGGGNCTVEVDLTGWVVEGDYQSQTAYRATHQRIISVILDIEGSCSAWLCREPAVGLMRVRAVDKGWNENLGYREPCEHRPLCSTHLRDAPVLDRASLADMKSHLGYEVRFWAPPC